MMHKAWSSIEEVPYCIARSSVKFHDHTGGKNWRFESNLRLLGRSQLSNPSDLPCYRTTTVNMYFTRNSLMNPATLMIDTWGNAEVIMNHIYLPTSIFLGYLLLPTLLKICKFCYLLIQWLSIQAHAHTHIYMDNHCIYLIKLCINFLLHTKVTYRRKVAEILCKISLLCQVCGDILCDCFNSTCVGSWYWIYIICILKFDWYYHMNKHSIWTLCPLVIQFIYILSVAISITATISLEIHGAISDQCR